MTIRCSQCGQTFKSNRIFEAHAPKCVPIGSTKPLSEWTMDELMASLKASGKA